MKITVQDIAISKAMQSREYEGMIADEVLRGIQ
jgi:hypothetical protein